MKLKKTLGSSCSLLVLAVGTSYKQEDKNRLQSGKSEQGTEKKRAERSIRQVQEKEDRIIVRFKKIQEDQGSGALVLIARFRAGLAGLNLGYPENPSLKPRKPS